MSKDNNFSSISFITACKGRLVHLKETLPRNLNWNKDYPNCQFIVLDYNSEDGLEEWMKKYMGKFIENGQLVYFKNFEPSRFKYSHSRNMLIRLATGRYVCNIDADNYTGKNFAFYINETLKKVDFLRGCEFYDNYIIPVDEGDAGYYGRLAAPLDLLLHLGGFDEEIEAWGYEDDDLYARLRASGKTSTIIDNPYRFCITHDDLMRFENSEKEQFNESYEKKMQKSRRRIENGILRLNEGNFGCGIVYKNFSSTPIEIDRYIY